MTKKQKGDIGLTKTIADLTANQVNVSLPIAEHLKYDLVIESKGKLRRVQVRYTSEAKGTNLLRVKLRSSWSNKSGNHYVNRKQGDYDILAVYCPNNDTVYYLSEKDFESQTEVALRTTVEMLKFGNQKTVRFADNFRDIHRCFGDDPAG